MKTQKISEKLSARVVQRKGEKVVELIFEGSQESSPFDVVFDEEAGTATVTARVSEASMKKLVKVLTTKKA